MLIASQRPTFPLDLATYISIIISNIPCLYERLSYKRSINILQMVNSSVEHASQVETFILLCEIVVDCFLAYRKIKLAK